MATAMEILLLGTGSADGWPNPFCGCASCADAAARAEIRGQTAALLDDVLLIECGTEVPRAAVRHRAPLTGLRHLLLTHAHFDHIGPGALLMRHWTQTTAPLHVWGPPSALAQCRPWVEETNPIRFHPLAPGDVVELDGYRVAALQANHAREFGGEALLYDVTAEGRILWATDTGPLPAATLRAVRDAAYDAVFLEETFGTFTDHGTQHHDLPAFAATVAALRDRGAVVAHTDVVAVHLGHHNPPDLAARLAACGARAGRDGETIKAGQGRATKSTQS
ncbi:MBL fold metallo-hydrolase [Mycolicibacillus parakoreensis]|uniref:MBL fold metallo-hydrolase n=1 Tax=Mycolicibacillus parakoreensis TaxID=1069221 RepID=A0ABY3U0J3_9MYCO|nr:MBL fold metallo-hydrolase [Mycolicibacillus parakoreensis]ULN52393.1 MBL fold metallo-hydrolase [Mycolicibacillus parakoreensis]